MHNFPSGTVTFLFTDIEGSTKLAQQYPEAIREKMGTPIPPIQRGDYDAHVQRLGSAFEEAWSQGLGMTMEEIIESALEENGS